MQRIEEELRAYIKIYNPEFVYIVSESFLAGSIDTVRNFTEMYQQFSIPFWFNTRPEDITEEKVRCIKEVGCKRISIGLEHGNEEFRKKFLKRNYSNVAFKRACEILRSHEISFSTNVIIGFPYETREMVFDTINVLRDVKPDGVSTHIFSPYHGSELRDICVKDGMISEDMIAEDFFHGDYRLKNPTISKEEILGLFRTIPLYVEMDKKEYARIRTAERLDEEGDKIFNELKKEFYACKGWRQVGRE